MTTANDEVAGLIANAIDEADSARDKAVTYTDTAQTIALGYTNLSANPTITPETFVVPPFNPTINLAAEYKTDFDTIWNDMEVWVRGLMDDYINTYFPILDPAIQAAENAWLLDVVNNGYLGIPAATETAIWDRARSREVIEAARMEDEAAAQFSARGFSLPPGALVGVMQAAQQEAANKSSTLSRDIAIKQAEISVEMTKFAIGEMTKLRLGIAAALADFMRAWLALPQVAADVAKTKAEMNRYLWDSSATYINALTNKAGLKLDADKAMLSAKVQSDQTWIQNYLGSQKLRVDAAMNAATQMGTIAGAYASSMNTLGNIGATTTYTG